MSPSHSQVETLSAYLDDELPAEEKTRLEQRLEQDPELRDQLEGLRSISAGLGHLERLAPPPTLGQDVARRIALAGEKRSLLDRIEAGLPGVQGQSNIFLMFAVIFALATIMYFFSQGLERHRLTPVTFDNPTSDDPAFGEGNSDGADFEINTDFENATTVLVAGKLFLRQGERWIEDGLDENEIKNARLIEENAAAELLESRPELRSVAQLSRAVLRLDGEIIELVAPP